MGDKVRFIVDQNVGKLSKWLRMMGYDTLFFTDEDDWLMVRAALAENRVILTRDTQVMSRGVVSRGRIKAILIQSEEPEEQIRQVAATLDLDYQSESFTICLECNQPLEKKSRQQVEGRVPAYVFQTQEQYMECPACHRIYWRGTHWLAMTERLKQIAAGRTEKGDTEG